MYSRLTFLSDNTEAELIPDDAKPKPVKFLKQTSYEKLHGILIKEEVGDLEYNYRFTKAYTKKGKTFTMSLKRIENLISINLLKAS